MQGEVPEAGTKAFKYWAFISYSHADGRWGDWLHKKLETYRVPRGLVGRASRDGSVPRRMFPIFRDREELTASSDLGANLKNSLQLSRYLVVICSPSAARSRWVNEEARFFKSHHGEDRVLCFIVGGSPNAMNNPGSQHLDCFAPALHYRVLPSGEVGSERTSPIAADARKKADRTRRATFKLIAGLLDVSFDELWHRERRRRVRHAIQGTVAVVALCALAAVGWDYESKQQTKRMLIAQYVNEGKQALDAGQRLQAAFYFTKARRVGAKMSALNEFEREAAKALVEPVTILRGHQDWITFATFIDAEHVLTTSWDKTVRLWDLRTGRSEVLVTELAEVTTARFSPDGRQFVTALWNGGCNIWTRNGVLVTKLDHGTHRVNWAEFSPDGKQVVTACDDNLARIWSLRQVEPLKPIVLSGHGSNVKMASFDREAKRVVTASFDMTASIWDATTGTALLTLKPHPAPVNAAVFSPDGKRVATACLDGSVLLWDATKKGNPKTLLGHAGKKRANSVAFNHDGSRLLTTGDDRTAKVWDVSTGELLLSYEQHDDIVVNGAFSGDGRRIVTASKDRTAAIFDATQKIRSISEIFDLAEKLGTSSERTQPKSVAAVNP